MIVWHNQRYMIELWAAVLFNSVKRFVMRYLHSFVLCLISGLLVTPLLSNPAQAEGECKLKTGKNFEIKPDQGPVTLNWVLENTSLCSVRVLVASDYAVNSISLQDQPNNGSIKQLSQTVFDYNKNNKFLGTDRFTVKICGKKSYGTSACSVVTYQMDSVQK